MGKTGGQRGGTRFVRARCDNAFVTHCRARAIPEDTIGNLVESKDIRRGGEDIMDVACAFCWERAELSTRANVRSW